MNLARYWVGRLWLRNGYCPQCNSSPPRPGCWVCNGELRYGPDLTPSVKRWWRVLWDRKRHATKEATG